MKKLSNYNVKAIKLHRNLIAFTFSRHFYMIIEAQKSPRKCIPLSILKIIVIFAFLTLCKQNNTFSLQSVRKTPSIILVLFLRFQCLAHHLYRFDFFVYFH